MKKKISLIFGTRPEAIKLAPVVHALKTQENVEYDICVTGQHREMLDQVLQIFEITPNVDLSVMQENQTLSTLTARLLTGIDSYLDESKPDLVLSQGDTTTVFVTALACFYRKIPFGHVEAGLRTYDLKAPWPEEGNRVLTTQISSLHFAPTQHAVENLVKEGVSKEQVFLTGNTVIDALHFVVNRLDTYKVEIGKAIPKVLLNTQDKIVLITGHRRENFDGGLDRVCKAINTLADKFPDVHFVYPVHLNPTVQETVSKAIDENHKNVHLINPLTYIPFVWLMQHSSFIVTDSGGIQEEAPSLGKPVLVTREVTERPEGVEAGSTMLVGTDIEKIVNTSERLLTDSAFYDSMSHSVNPYGDGKSGEKIVTLCKKYLYGT